MEKLEIRMQEELFDVETQYCDPDDCYHDCKLNVPNYCNEVVTLYWQKYLQGHFCFYTYFPGVIIW